MLTHACLDESTLSHVSGKISEILPKDEYHLRLAFCVPGILHIERKISQLSPNDALESFKVNTLGPLLQMKHFSEFLPRKASNIPLLDAKEGLPPESSVFAVMSARVGSITDNKAGGWYSYRASKAGVTQVAKTFDMELQSRSDEKAMCVALHPGTVRTDFTEGLRGTYEKMGKVISREESAEALLNVVNRLGKNQRGRFYDWKGEEIPP